jgi:hypothetical protein
MKHIVCLLAMVMMIHTSADAQKKIFLRFYDFSGYKFEKGRLIASTDSSIVVSRDTLLIEIPISKIYSIKTKRSYGHNALMSSFALAGTGGIIGYASGDPITEHSLIISFTKPEAAFIGVFLGSLSGLLTGALISGGNQTFVIGGDKEIWKRINKQITTKRKAGI